ncbi:universal stress protein [Lentisphaera profundi]|uniref:Universal stress protein n=1 Tax=Lentisphaera profundi TaxID=1658616 RepID=A0ABY7VS81_9BACT|nr:universal stress protein [Lentisphaera profundi]WDE95634.1 universal stress protein [Lentisphaera profundi]
MMHIDNIVTGVFSEHHFSMAVRESQKLATVFKAKIRPVHVIETLGFNPFYPRETEESRLGALEKFKKDVDHLYNKHGASHVEEPVVQIGRIHNELVAVANKHSNSLIVVGRHTEGVMHKFLTTEAERIIAHASTPVWVHPHRSISRLPQTIVCALDFSENCKRAADVAVMVAKACSAQIYFVHVIPESTGYVDLEGQLNVYYPQEDVERDLIHDNVLKLMKEAVQNLDLEGLCYAEKVCSGGAADGVKRVCDEVDAELLVMGASSHSSVERLFMGSTMRWLLNDFKEDILVIP